MVEVLTGQVAEVREVFPPERTEPWAGEDAGSEAFYVVIRLEESDTLKNEWLTLRYKWADAAVPNLRDKVTVTIDIESTNGQAE